MYLYTGQYMDRKKILIVSIMGGLFFISLAWLFATPEATITNYPPEGATIVAVGDSLVEGVGSSNGGGFISDLEERLGVPIANYGVQGETSADVLARIDDVIETDPDVVILLVGGNDVLQLVKPEYTFANIREIVERLQDSGAVVIVLGIRGGIHNRVYQEEFESLSEELGTYYVSDVLEDIFARPNLMSDFLHPNDEGYERIADRVEPILEGLVQKDI